MVVINHIYTHQTRMWDLGIPIYHLRYTRQPTSTVVTYSGYLGAGRVLEAS